MKKISRLSPLVISLITASVLSAQGILERDMVPLKNWDAPMYWQPSVVESKDAAAKQLLAGNAGEDRASSITPQAQTPANSLVFVGMTPCRVVDTRTGSGFTGAFGPPSLIGGSSRTFPIQSSSTCPIPSVAQAYSFNITVVPPGFLDFITVWPTGQARPNASTLNGYVGTVIANAAIIPAGTSGAVDVYASQNTHLIIDINGYYAQQSGITLTQGTAGAPSLSFAGDSGTGMFSSGVGNVNIATSGTSRIHVASNGNVGIGTTNPAAVLTVVGNSPFNAQVHLQGSGNAGGALRVFPGGTGRNGAVEVYETSDTSLTNHSVGFMNMNYPVSGGFNIFTSSGGTGTALPMVFGTAGVERMRIGTNGNIGIGRAPHFSTRLSVLGGIHSEQANGPALFGIATGNGTGVSGVSEYGFGVWGESDNSYGVYGSSDSNYAGYFSGNLHVTGNVTSGSDARLKQGVSNLSYGLRELLQLRPVTWNWKAKPDNGRQLGLIAQEVETVLPELVSTDKDTEQTKGLNYIGLVPVTIRAIQEQQAQIEGQQECITKQEERISEQQEQLEEQQRQIDRLKLLVCLDHPEVTVCK